ncbi:MAG: TetR/AcrR family transcriptional regulator [Candidatus Electrothrix aestuarii]|uniref:TetR/AcrR family transcriptional regulator n=1 Tax=Candidatus Electrothrix aestuarii TaxID=3062594 RepID=A0AAU8M1C8_9BACT|nr:TetR/AcrR family transcriptional regulator [Candidatus Electrothrix aestuarii]WPD23861.1 MAG: TetR/AcrR family transcriptional regulator [Candidatus Electrothrix sp. GW3-3]
MPEKKLTRREREKQRQRRDMLDAAMKLFAEKGYHNASMQEIAEHAEFAVGTLYKFFKNKEDMYKALVTEQADRFHVSLSAALASSEDEIEQLRSYIQTKGEVFMSNESFIRLYFAETRGASFNIKAGLDSELRDRHHQMLQRVAAIFARGMEKGRFRRIAAPFHMAVAMDSLCNAFLTNWLEGRDTYPESPDTILNIFFQGLLASEGSAITDI